MSNQGHDQVGISPFAARFDLTQEKKVLERISRYYKSFGESKFYKHLLVFLLLMQKLL